MPRVDPGRQIAIFPMPSFDDHPERGPEMHIWVDSLAPRDQVLDDLPQSQHGPPTPTGK